MLKAMGASPYSAPDVGNYYSKTRVSATLSYRAALIFVLLAVAGVPLAFAPGLLLEYEVIPKLVVLLISTAGLLACWPAWYPGVRGLVETRQGQIFAGLLCLQAASLVVSTAVAPQPELALAGSAWRRYGVAPQLALLVLAFLTASAVAARRSLLSAVLPGIAVASGIASIYAVVQYAGWDPFLSRSLYTTHYYGDLLRVPSTLGHAVYLGSFLAATLPLTLWLAADSSGNKRTIYISIGGVSLLALLLSGSRSATAAAVAGVAISIIGGKRLRIDRKVAMVAACAAIVILLALLTGDLGASFRLRLTQWRQDVYGGPRLVMWRDSVTLIGRHAVLGTGPESFGTQFRRVQSAELSRAYPDFSQESPHNVFLAAAVEQGIPGLVVIAGLVWLLFATRPPRDGPGPALRASGIAMFICISFLTVTIHGALMLYLAVGWLIAVSARADASAGRPPSALVPATLSLAIVLMAVAGAYLRQDLAYREIGRASLGGMTSALDTVAGMRFPGAGDDLWASRQFAAHARASTGESAARAWAASAAASARAERSGDDFAAAAFQSALLSIGRNDAAAAENKLRETIAAAPNWYKPHLLLAQLVRFGGRTAESDLEAARALDLAGELRGDIQKALGIAGH
jgi:O-antigen ligase